MKKININKRDLIITVISNLILILVILIIIFIIVRNKNKKVNNIQDNSINSANNEVVENANERNEEININDLSSLKDISDKEIAFKFYDDYIDKIKNSPEQAYNLLNIEYKNKKYPNLEKFMEYINNYKKIQFRSLATYTLKRNDSYYELVCEDDCGFIWIFNITSSSDYKVILDTYTISSKIYDDEYKNSENAKKAQLCLNRFFEALNNKDYNIAYEYLNSEYKKNNFANVDDFKNYVLTNWFEYIYFDYSDAKIDNNENYEFSGIIGNTEEIGSYGVKHIQKTFFVKLGLGLTDFQMSFEK